MKRLFAIIKRDALSAKTLFGNGEYKPLFRLLLKWLAVLAAIGGSIALIVLGMTSLFRFLAAKFEILVIGSVILASVIAWAKSKTASDGNNIPDAPDSNADRANRTYQTIAKVLLELFQKAAKVFPLVYPNSESDIYSPSRAANQNGIWHYQYVLLKSDGTVDLGAVSRFLKEELERMLLSGDFFGLPANTRFVNGLEVPVLMVDTVKDAGGYLLVDVVVMSENARRRNAGIQRMNLEKRNTPTDTDDDEFL